MLGNPFQRYSALLLSKGKKLTEAEIQAEVEDLERRNATLKSKVLNLESQVGAAPSLATVRSQIESSAPLLQRVEALQGDVKDLRARVTDLEGTIVGLQT